ncbi:hypothetical protein [uncultured Stenotrophomonas sp.]|uniref:hypothetical protein n=1 Tax=uncultured Stenotrophomonas sp. TaxID=165438 RepID=UPI0025CF0226|nr:hypothetical protein [uncultured Stenotrophomonas sp.]
MAAKPRFFYFKLPDLELIASDVQLEDTSIRWALNEPAELTASLDRATAYQQVRVESTGETVPLIRDHGTLIVVIEAGTAHSFIVDYVIDDDSSQDRLMFSAVGFGSIPMGEPWRGPAYKEIQVDPLDVFRHAWEWVTSDPSTLNVSVDTTQSPVRIGEEERDVSFETDDGDQVDFSAGPYRLNWWTTDDIGKELADLASNTPFEWREETRLSADSDDPPEFRIRLGYPRLGAPRRDDLKFTIGVNVTEPAQDDSIEFFSDVFVIGAGEGSAKVRGQYTRSGHGRMRKTKVISDQSITSRQRADEVAREHADKADRDEQFISSCRVLPHDAAPIGSYSVGDVITITGRMSWGTVEQDGRIVSLERRFSDDSVLLELERISE